MDEHTHTQIHPAIHTLDIHKNARELKNAQKLICMHTHTEKLFTQWCTGLHVLIGLLNFGSVIWTVREHKLQSTN